MEQGLKSSGVATIGVMTATLASRLLGFVRIALVSAYFGGSGQADVLNLVFNIPNNLRKLLAEGALSSAFIPVLAATRIGSTANDEGRRLVRQILSFQIVILIPLTVLSTVFADLILTVALRFPDQADQLLAVDLFRWLIHYLTLVSVGAVLVATLNTHSRFFLPAVSPLLFSIAVIVSLVTLHARLGIFAMAVGVLVGGALQIGVLVPGFLRLRYSFRFTWNLQGALFRQVMVQWLPVVMTASVFTINQQVAMLFASELSPGSGTAMSNALVFWQLPFGIFSASITTVLFPRMSRQATADDLPGLRKTVSYGLSSLFALLVPSAAILAVLNREMIAVALQRGAFAVRYTEMAGDVLFAYCFGLFSVGAFSFLQRYFYSRRNFRTPLVVAIAVLVVDVGLSIILKTTRLQVQGLAVANSVAFTGGFLVLFFSAYRDLRGVRMLPLFFDAAKVVVVTLVAVGVAILVQSSWGYWWVGGSSAIGFVRVGGLCLAIGLLIGALFLLLKVEVVNVLRRTV